MGKGAGGATAAMIRSEDPCRALMKERSFDDLDRLERGDAREMMTEDKHLQPHSAEKETWTRCYVLAEDKSTVFRRYRQSDDAFWLSARRVDDDYHIFLYEKPPEVAAGAKKKGGEQKCGDAERSCSVLRRRGRGFTLFSRSCEYCDNSLHKYTCGQDLYENGDRQTMAHVQHRMETVKCGGGEEVQARFFDVKIPGVTDEGHRMPWCPRVIRDSDSRSPQLGEGEKEGQALRLHSRLPAWNDGTWLVFSPFSLLSSF